MKPTFIKKTLLVLILLSTALSFSQTEVKNKIVDFSSLMPIESASIYVKETTIGTVSNSDGKFILQVPNEFATDTLVISSIGYKSYKVPVDEFDNSFEIYLEEDVASLDEILLVAETRPKTGNDIVLKAIEKLVVNMPDSAYLQKGFLRHKERNKLEFKWLIESAITVYDSGYGSKSAEELKINVDQMRKSYDLRDVDSIFSYVAYTNQTSARSRIKPKDVNRRNLSKAQLVKAIKWNDERVNGLQNLFEGKLNLVRNANDPKALFGEDMLKKHQFELDTILVDNDRKLYKIQIEGGEQFVGLDTEGIFNEGYTPKGWLYIYYDNYAIKKVEYELEAASDAQKVRSKRLFDTTVNHKLVITYIEYDDKMYPNYVYYETPKLVNVGIKSTQKISKAEEARYNKEERYYYTVQEILFSEIVLDKDKLAEARQQKWDDDIFSAKPYNKSFWENYNILLESEEDEQLISDLSKRASLFKE
ncbi:carboxypeptidase-like regulatory domain-containing protein [Subsaximicrobium wynnwilliamsii]|uniref:Carboxypeptidase-like regulatory domain-containing protein n=1 Tax=Subsaximicrobium wynnwilliamsii TaxID=291179 RepID=A0A5C6ZD42_9FLAO|nr:carboxypeptidase-like regulatory domain-containing protein [Subsaximicrobium wynnwilliamsii]TXD81757.1 carboxypeptidase-like regulatory domain-containing protein [Subsaximicrobium wynnwilliamsii]TXD87583.1 carboxypeptidase-like regulatory domain-containing protein [Subsaximicrobium wynnwilliamsii]TXE01256.1 carboxypeptidase-like regulatory domain-containing protein [Subsaximicrobium wynnwilliamsii]